MQTASPSMPVRYGISSEWIVPSLGYLPSRRSRRRVQRDEGDDEDSLPQDPRQWSREHVAAWLDKVSSLHGIPEVPQSRFMMNGKALCLMSPGMFLSRVPLGGKLLYKDFQLRLSAALYSVN